MTGRVPGLLIHGPGRPTSFPPCVYRFRFRFRLRTLTRLLVFHQQSISLELLPLIGPPIRMRTKRHAYADLICGPMTTNHYENYGPTKY